tara:strand:+ start:48 stop:566 length:519 start_codon:yes stop_codon:yes gene_type:complete
MKEDKDILNNLKRTEKPSVPNGFFDSFSDQLMTNINDSTFLESLQKENKPEVPNGFFESFSNNLIKEIESEIKPVKKAKIIPLRIMLAVTSVAAVITFVVLVTNQNKQPIIVETVTEEFADEDYDAYLAYLDESSIVDFIIENNLSIDDYSEIDESIYSEIEGELDNYYYDL